MTSFVEFLLYHDRTKKVLVNVDKITTVLKVSVDNTCITFGGDSENYVNVASSYYEVVGKLRAVSRIIV